MNQMVFTFIAFVTFTAFVSCSPLRQAREVDSIEQNIKGDATLNAIEPSNENTKQDLSPAETFWGPGPGPWGPPPPWAFGPGPFGPWGSGPFGPGPFGPFGPGPDIMSSLPPPLHKPSQSKSFFQAEYFRSVPFILTTLGFGTLGVYSIVRRYLTPNFIEKSSQNDEKMEDDKNK